MHDSLTREDAINTLHPSFFIYMRTHSYTSMGRHVLLYADSNRRHDLSVLNNHADAVNGKK